MSLLDEAREKKAVADGQDPRMAELERIATELHTEGIDFRVEHGRIIQSAQDRDRDRETTIDLAKNHYRFGLVSDTHAGSKFEQNTALHQFYRYADEECEVDAFLHCGDWHQGSSRMHLGMEHEVHAHGSEAQVDYAARTYPKSARGTKTYGIGGNHDASFKKDGGANVVRQLASQRDDIVYLGEDAAYLTLGGLRAYLLHPDGGGAYAKSYKAQKIAESLPPDKDVRLLLLGHYHVWGQFKERRTHTLMLPAFQSQYSWLARKGLHPDIGGVVLDVWFDDDGSLARIKTELLTFEPRDEDYDHEVSREVNRAWSSKGLAV